MKRKEKFSTSKNVYECERGHGSLEVSESYAYKLMKRVKQGIVVMGCQTIAGKVDRKYFYEQFYGTRSNMEELGMAIYKNDNGTWYVMIVIRLTGARKQKRGFSTRKEAADWELCNSNYRRKQALI